VKDPVIWGRRSADGPAVLAALASRTPHLPSPLASVNLPSPGNRGLGPYLLLLVGIGLLLMTAALLPVHLLRPAAVYGFFVTRRIDIGLLGLSVVLMVGMLYLLFG
jgi:hypothetical protein